MMNMIADCGSEQRPFADGPSCAPSTRTASAPNSTPISRHRRREGQGRARKKPSDAPSTRPVAKSLIATKGHRHHHLRVAGGPRGRPLRTGDRHSMPLRRSCGDRSALHGRDSTVPPPPASRTGPGAGRITHLDPCSKTGRGCPTNRTRSYRRASGLSGLYTTLRQARQTGQMSGMSGMSGSIRANWHLRG